MHRKPRDRPGRTQGFRGAEEGQTDWQQDEGWKVPSGPDPQEVSAVALRSVGNDSMGKRSAVEGFSRWLSAWAGPASPGDLVKTATSGSQTMKF